MSHHLESKSKKTMKAKHLSLALVTLLAAGGLWLARSAWRSDRFASHKSSTDVGSEMPGGRPTGVGSNMPSDRPKSGQMLRPPDTTRRFTDFTPEQRVQQ